MSKSFSMISERKNWSDRGHFGGLILFHSFGSLPLRPTVIELVCLYEHLFFILDLFSWFAGMTLL